MPRLRCRIDRFLLKQQPAGRNLFRATHTRPHEHTHTRTHARAAEHVEREKAAATKSVQSEHARAIAFHPRLFDQINPVKRRRSTLISIFGYLRPSTPPTSPSSRENVLMDHELPSFENGLLWKTRVTGEFVRL